MPSPYTRIAVALVCLPLALPAQRATPAVDPRAVVEVRAFMDDYARELRAGDKERFIARYDRAGVYFLGSGVKELTAFDSIPARYAAWRAPAAFAWDDLSFEPVAPDAVVVAGRLRWTVAGVAAPTIVSYTALLRKRDGAWRIRLEDESVDPSTLPKPAPKDSMR